MPRVKRGRAARTMYRLQIVQGLEQRQINRNRGALKMTELFWKSPADFTRQDIAEYYDQNPGITLKCYAEKLGVTVQELEDILSSED